ncbi:hypothetical protein [Pedobacter psychroterrae]|uniref:hypothetical protein n=1 Tax=Pedobacter psychroterrae TaxID=2530453 RepID=UPI0013F173F5|nr:hypothetical protein [Pedobacter psychroterrae]
MPAIKASAFVWLLKTNSINDYHEKAPEGEKYPNGSEVKDSQYNKWYHKNGCYLYLQ